MEPKTEKKKWYSVTVTSEPQAEIAVDTAFGILDSAGTEVDTLGKRDSETVDVIGYFDSQPAIKEVLAALDGALKAHGFTRSSITDVKTERVEEKDWLEEWKKNWRASAVKRFLIAPPWEDVGETKKIVIRIEPQMAFGTGTHETTRLCLEFIDSDFQAVMSFLDVGTGTGILAIAAAKIAGIDPVKDFTAYDVDRDSIVIASKNAELNGVSGIVFEDGTITGTGSKYDFVCANMTIDIIKPMLELLVAKTGKILVLSGILFEQEEEILERLKELSAPIPTILRDGEWIALRLCFD
jgi:ribosomal protein L11 methyltransferase